MIRLFSIIILVLFVSFQQKKGVEVSFFNDSGEDFKTITITTDKKEYRFFNLKNGKRTRTIYLHETYWFIQTIAVTQKDTLEFSGFCYVGETLIRDGKLEVSYAIYPKEGEYRRLIANQVSYSGSAKNVGFPKYNPDNH